jgi:hypothetical protein
VVGVRCSEDIKAGGGECGGGWGVICWRMVRRVVGSELCGGEQ